MSSLTVLKEHDTGATLISNRFIDDYMKDANDAQIKIYLYLLRVVSAHGQTSVSDMADKFNHTEKDVVRALKYWEKHKVLLLDYDASRNLTGIRLQELSPVSEDSLPAAGGSLHTSEDSLLALDNSLSASESSLSASEVSEGSGKEIREKRIQNTIPEKPVYTLDQLKAFKEQEEVQQILFITEQYIGKPLSPTEIKSIFYIYDVLGFSADLIDYLVQYCVGRDKKDFRYIEKVAISWAESKIKTPKQAASLSRKYDKAVYTIMSALGKSSTPVAKEVDYITKWTKTYGYTMDLILEACNRTVLAVDSHRFEYADSVLSSWFKANIHHLTEVKAADEKFKKSKVPANALKNSFNQFQQHDYDFDALEKKLLRN